MSTSLTTSRTLPVVLATTSLISTQPTRCSRLRFKTDCSSCQTNKRPPLRGGLACKRWLGGSFRGTCRPSTQSSASSISRWRILHALLGGLKKKSFVCDARTMARRNRTSMGSCTHNAKTNSDAIRIVAEGTPSFTGTRTSRAAVVCVALSMSLAFVHSTLFVVTLQSVGPNMCLLLS